MESHILNTFHQARFRPIGHKILRMKSDSISSESSCNQNSPEYPQISVSQRHSDSSNGDWCRSKTMNTTQSSQETSSDDESSDPEESMEDLQENLVQGDAEDSEEEIEDGLIDHDEDDVDEEDDDVEVDDEFHEGHSNLPYTMQIGVNGFEDNSLIEGHDYDVVAVYTVNPDLDLVEASSDEECEEYTVSTKDVKPTACVDSYTPSQQEEQNTSICQNSLDINLDTPVVSNVDEYFIKNNNGHDQLLESDGPVVKDVDEYFIKDKGKESPVIPNVDDFFIKHKVHEEESTKFHIPESTPTVDEFVIADTKKIKEEICENTETEPENVDVSINESDLEVLPNIEDLKRYLLEDMSYTKFRNIQRSCSVPQSPMQHICLDIDDAKTCLSFEDLNLDLSDLTFDNYKDKPENNKSDDIPRTLTDEDVNSFLITNNRDANATEPQDDLSQQDMEIEPTLPEPSLTEITPRKMTSTPLPTVLDFCIEKKIVKKEVIDYSPKKVLIKKEILLDPKVEQDDFVDVESCNDATIPVLAANNLNSLLEQFEATEKLNTTKIVTPVIKTEDVKVKEQNKISLTTGMRLQDAGVQLNKNKMRQILMPTPIHSTVRRSQSPVHSDHDYCSSKKRHSLPNLKGGQSLLKPEVLSSNSRILNSRHRSCKSKKVVYHLSSDDEAEGASSKNKKVKDDIDTKKKISVKPSVKSPVQSNCRKKLSPTHSAPDSLKDKSNNSVMIKSACKASDNCSQNSNGSIKLTIKNKSEVILNCDYIDSQKNKNIEKCKNSVSDKTNNVEKQDKNSKDLARNKGVVVNSVETVVIKEEPRPKDEHFYTALFSNKQDVKIPLTIQPKTEKRPFEEELNKCMEAAIKKEAELPLKKKKLNLQEYKLRRGVSNNSSAAVSPEAIFPDMPNPGLGKAVKCPNLKLPPDEFLNNANKVNNEQTFFDPIKEASRKILMNTKKQKAEAMRKRDEDIVMSKIPKMENLELQPLISDAEMLKIVGMTQPNVPVPIVNEKPQLSDDYEEIILVSIGTNTDENMFTRTIKRENPKATSPTDVKSVINFKIKKSDHVLKHNVFDNVKRDKRSPIDEKKHSDIKIDKDRYKDITATLKSVEKQVDTKISSNSLFASIQDVVMKKAPEKVVEKSNRHAKVKYIEYKCDKSVKTMIVREFDAKADHGEDKVILHLDKHRSKPVSTSVSMQTDSDSEFIKLPGAFEVNETPNRKRNDSDMSLSSDSSIPRNKETSKLDDKIAKTKPAKPERLDLREKRSRSKDRHELRYRRRSRSVSRSRRRWSRSRSRSRSRGRYRRYRRSDSPYKRKRRSRSPYKRRSPSIRRDRSNRTRSKSKATESKSPVKKNKVVATNGNTANIVKPMKSMTPPLRKPTVSESSDSSTGSSSSSSSSSSNSSTASRASRVSRVSRMSCSPYKRVELYKKPYRSFSSEDRENNTPVEERRIVFVGRLDKDVTKSTLRSQFSKFGSVIEVRLHHKEDGSRYGFVTFQRPRDAWTAVESASTFPQYDVGFGGRRAFCRQSYADLDGLEAKYTESSFHGQSALQARRNEDMTFEQMLLEMKKKLSQRKNDKNRPEDTKP